MLADNLGNSPHLYVFPLETRIIPWLIKHLNDYGDLKEPVNLERLLSDFSKSRALRKVAPDLGITVSEVAEPTLSGVVDAVFRKIAISKKGVSRWAEKSPMNIQHMIDIAEMIPTARFLHIYRDGRDAAISNKRRWNKPLRWSMYRWAQIVSQGRIDGGLLGTERYFELSYEDLTKEPEKWLNRICIFIGIPYEDDLLRSSMPYFNSLSRLKNETKSGDILPNSEKWKTHLQPRDLIALEKLGGRLLSELGYNTRFPNSQDMPSAWQIRLWELSDYLTKILHLSKRHRQFMRSPALLWRLIRDGLRYKRTLRH